MCVTNFRSELRARQEREKWMVSIAECLLFVLDQCNPTGSASGTPTGNTARDPMLSSPVTHLAPVLAGLFLEVALSFGVNTLENFQNIHWIFWELAKVRGQVQYSVV